MNASECHHCRSVLTPAEATRERCPVCGQPLIHDVNAKGSTPKSPSSDTPAESQARRGLPTIAKALIVVGVLAILVCVEIWLQQAQMAKQRQQLESDLRTFAYVYHVYNDRHKRAPSSLADLEAFVEDLYEINSPAMNRAVRVFEVIRNGRFIIIWDAMLTRNGNENDKYVLGFEPNVSEDGGFVMRGGGSVQTLTADEFKAMPMIKTRAE